MGIAKGTSSIEPKRPPFLEGLFELRHLSTTKYGRSIVGARKDVKDIAHAHSLRLDADATLILSRRLIKAVDHAFPGTGIQESDAVKATLKTVIENVTRQLFTWDDKFKGRATKR
jgi:hypothetical protein